MTTSSGIVTVRRDTRPCRGRELESVLQQVRDRRREGLSVGIDRDTLLDARHRQPDATRSRVDRGRHFDLLHELIHRHALEPRSARVEANLGERTIYEIAQIEQAALVHRAHRASDRDNAPADAFEREHRGREQVSQLVREDSEALSACLRHELLALFGEVCDGSRDGSTEACVEPLEILRGEVRAAIDRELLHGLADVAVVVNHLRDSESHSQEIDVRRSRGRGPLARDFIVGHVEVVRELAQEQRNTVRQLVVGGRRRGSRGDLRAGLGNELVAVGREEIAEHRYTSCRFIGGPPPRSATTSEPGSAGTNGTADAFRISVQFPRSVAENVAARVGMTPIFDRQ